jgi:methylase of polypeptide subunit release factors
MDVRNLGRAPRYADLRHFLADSGYSEAAICRRYELAHAEDFELDRRRRPRPAAPQSAAQILCDVFLAGDSVTHEAITHLLGANAVQLLDDTGLIAPVSTHAIAATVALYPVDNLYIASDRWNCADERTFVAADDLVYPAFIPNTRLFLRHLPARPGRFLDLCAGTGAAALLAAQRGAPEAWAADITARSTAFADFNRKLNGLDSVRAVASDLYEELTGSRFACIAAHPPYVPTLRPKWIFFSGGDDGEAITRRIVEGVPEHLEEGGVFCALTMGSDRSGHPYQERVREWLGERGREFDVAVVVRRELDPREFAERANREAVRPREESEAWRALFAQREVEALVYGFVFLSRHEQPRPAVTVRRQAAGGRGRAPWEWLLAWEGARASGAARNVVLASRLRAIPAVEFHVMHRLSDEGWRATAYRLQVDFPFRAECQAQPWMAHLLSLCDGRITGHEAWVAMRRAGAVPESTPEGEFAQAVTSLVSGGFLEAEGFTPLPAAE